MTDWVLLRGLTRESRHWGDFPQHLGEKFANARVICLDLPGNGRLNGLPSLPSVEAMADYCHAELANLGVARPCRILAMSLGAMVTVAWAQRHPQDIQAAVLINTSLRPFNAFYRRLRPANYFRLLRLARFRSSGMEREAAILKMTTRQVDEPERVIRQWLTWRLENPVSGFNAFRQLVAAARYRAPRQSPIRRLLLLAGAGDALVDPVCSRQLATCWNARIEIHPLAGHDLPLDDGMWVLEQVRRWLESDNAQT